MTMTRDPETTRALIALLRGLRAVRQFRSEPVPEAVLEDVLDVARWSGSAINKQPWELLLVRERDTLNRLARVDGARAGHLAGASLGIVLVMNGSEPVMETFDEGRLSERILLTASAHGVGGCIGWFVGPASEEAKRILGVPAERFVRTSISLGYPDEEARRARPRSGQPRKPLDAMVYRERYEAR